MRSRVHAQKPAPSPQAAGCALLTSAWLAIQTLPGDPSYTTQHRARPGPLGLRNPKHNRV